ncbi:hypothetical protein BST97_05045 [Nonlabens spongiae]|uniref:Uncharacterized protein n=2 Tax=Nonlabens spongiae TaxID=331648 RepID=A0A1W6MIW3_9FLAO|nr:hypothetical protein BST97_05045 [Nonlabens spongiae]
MNSNHRYLQRKRAKSRSSNTQIILIYFISLMMIFRYVSSLISFDLWEHEKYLYDEYTLVAYLLLTFIFLYNWNMIATIYQSLKAQLLSIPIWLVVSYLISLTYYLI